MTIRDEILEELGKRTPLAEILSEFRSKSQLCQEVGRILERADKKWRNGF